MKKAFLPLLVLICWGTNQIWGQNTSGMSLLSVQVQPNVISDSSKSEGLDSMGGAIEIETVQIRSLPNPETTLLSRIDLGIRNIQSGQELLLLTPGLLIAQHAGGGKAEQMFFRGFDLDHGTDLALRVDGIPVNQVSHAHGQGYSDLHFLIPETVGRTELSTGPSNAREGNFATAGSLHLQTLDRLNQNLIKTEYGSFGTFRTVGLIGLPEKEGRNLNGYFAGEFLGSRGYFEQPQQLRRLNLFAKLNGRLSSRTTFKANLSWFQSSWDASGQVPERAVESGMITRFGAIDPTEGGETARKMASFALSTELSEKSSLNQQVYFVRNDFQLFSNFTFYLNNPVEGDRIRQTENRYQLGYQTNWSHLTKWKGIGIASEIGGGFRTDLVNNLELAWMNSREDLREQIQDGKVTETNTFAYWTEKFYFHEDWKLEVGLRQDVFRFAYRDDLAGMTSESSWQGRTSPKLRLDWSPKTQLNVFAKAGLGFHSNDSRTSAFNPTQALPRASGVDAGIIWKPWSRMVVQATAWALHLQQELVYVGDEGIVEASGAAKRIGLDLSLRYQLKKGLVANVDLNYAHARYENGDYVPLAPAFSSSGGLSGQISDRWSGRIGYRYLMDRPANEDGSLTASGFFLTQASVRYALTKSITLGVNGNNLLNQEWKEAQFATTSQLLGESAPVEEIHFTPGAPRSFNASLEIQF